MKARKSAAKFYFRRGALFIWLALLTACGSLAPPLTIDETAARLPPAGPWTLAYTGACQDREAESLLINHLTEAEIAFDEFRLLRAEDGQYIGSADFIAPMPADGRDIVYTIAYRLQLTAAGRLVGTETIIESGGHGLACPIELAYR